MISDNNQLHLEFQFQIGQCWKCEAKTLHTQSPISTCVHTEKPGYPLVVTMRGPCAHERTIRICINTFPHFNNHWSVKDANQPFNILLINLPKTLQRNLIYPVCWPKFAIAPSLNSLSKASEFFGALFWIDDSFPLGVKDDVPIFNVLVSDELQRFR